MTRKLHISAIALVLFLLAGMSAMAESPYIFGTFFWAEGVNIDSYSGKPGWVVNQVQSEDFRSIGWNHQYKQAVDEGHTWILRFGYGEGAPGVPLNSAEWPRYAAQCAQWAERIGDYVHIYVIGNEMHLSSISDADYAACYLMVREAIHAVQPDAIVVPGVVPSNKLRAISLIAGDYIDGFTDFHPGYGLLAEIDSWTDIPGVRTKPFYVTEQGAAPPMPDNRARQHFSEYNTWNLSNDHKIESGCWFVYYSLGNEYTSMLMVPMTSADFEEAALNAYYSSYAAPYIYLSNITVNSTDEVTSVVSWSTDVPSTSSVEYWKEGDRTRHMSGWSSYAQTPKTSHSVQLSELEAGATYRCQIRTYSAGRPWTRSPVKTFVQQGPQTGAITGRVLSSGVPVHNAAVTRWYEHSANNELSVYTSADGTFTMKGIPVGTHHIRVSANGAGETMLSPVVVSDSQTTNLGDLSLTGLQNLVSTNPGFETGTLSGWTVYGDNLQVESGPWFGGIMPHSGTKFGARATNYGVVNGGVYQRVPATAGQQYVARVFSNIYRGDSPYSDTVSRVGIDPTGGTNSSSTAVKWSDYQMAYDDWEEGWRELATPAVTCGAGGYVTIFLSFNQYETYGWHINCFDDAGIFLRQTLSTIPEPAPLVEPKESIAEAKASPDGTRVSLSGVVTTTRHAGDFVDGFWIEDEDRSSGIMVHTGGYIGLTIPEGGVMSLTATLSTLASGERALIYDSLQPQGTRAPLRPLYMPNREVGGADHLYDAGPPPSGQKGVLNGRGLNNVGLLVRVSGEVKSIGTGSVMISDGSGANLKVVTTKLSVQPTVGQQLVATGMCRVEKIGDDLIPYIELRRSTDAIVY